MAYALKKMRLSEILDQGTAILKDNFALFFQIMLFLYVPFQVVVLLLTLAVTPPINPQNAGDINVPVQATGVIVVGIVAGLGGAVISIISGAAILYAVAARYLGKSITAGQAIGAAASKASPLIVTAIMVGVAVMCGFVLLIIPGLILALLFSLSQYVVMLENQSGWAAMKRSKELVSGDWTTLIGLGIVIVVISFFGGFVSGLIPVQIVSSLLQILVQTLVVMLSAAVTVVYYFSRRCALENFDLQNLADAVKRSDVPAEGAFEEQI